MPHVNIRIAAVWLQNKENTRGLHATQPGPFNAVPEPNSGEMKSYPEQKLN